MRYIKIFLHIFFVRAFSATFDTFKDNNSKDYSPMKNSMKFGVAAVAGAATLAGTVAPSHAYAYVPPAPTPAPVTTPTLSHTQAVTTSNPLSYTAAPTFTEPTAYAVSGVNYAAPMTDANWSTSWTPTQTYTDTTGTQTNLSTQANTVTPVELPADSVKSAIVQTALQGEGSAYVWGGKTFGAWDCSGFVSWVFAQHGINLTSYTYAMKNELTPTSTPQPGDIVFTNGYSHVGIYLGNGQMISALNPAQGTIITSVDGGGYMPVDGYYTI